jgi:adenine-specific DNA methylase
MEKSKDNIRKEITEKITRITQDYGRISELVNSRSNTTKNTQTNNTTTTKITTQIKNLQGEIDKNKQELDMLLAAGNPGGDGDPNQSQITTSNNKKTPEQNGGSMRSKRKSSKKQKKGKTHKRKH